ncbi:hypothetical protein PMAYCL1PPCAC_04578, partial [Pristionchus mayeri]
MAGRAAHAERANPGHLHLRRGDDERKELLGDETGEVYGCTLKELRNLMDFREDKAVDRINSLYGGVEGICQRLKADPVNGLPNNPEEIAKRARAFGKNEIPPARSKTYLQLVWEALQDTTLMILMASAAISLCLSFYTPPNAKHNEDSSTNWIEGVAILVAVLAVVTVTALNDWTKERQFRGLQAKIDHENHFSVIRGGEEVHVVVNELVVGDIARVKYGDLLPADGVLIQSNDLKIDESAMTGESDLIRKSADRDPMLLSGTHAMEGSGRFLITAVGVNSRTGIIMSLLGSTAAAVVEAQSDSGVVLDEEDKDKKALQADEDPVMAKSVLHAKLSKLALQMGYAGSVIALLTIAILLVRFCVIEYIIGRQPVKIDDLNHLVHYIIIGVTVLVIAVPEGLPLAITLALTYSVKKMMKDNNLVRHLDAC